MNNYAYNYNSGAEPYGPVSPLFERLYRCRLNDNEFSFFECYAFDLLLGISFLPYALLDALDYYWFEEVEAVVEDLKNLQQ